MAYAVVRRASYTRTIQEIERSITKIIKCAVIPQLQLLAPFLKIYLVYGATSGSQLLVTGIIQHACLMRDVLVVSFQYPAIWISGISWHIFLFEPRPDNQVCLGWKT